MDLENSGKEKVPIKISKEGEFPIDNTDKSWSVLFESEEGYMIRNFNDIIPSTVTAVADLRGKVKDLDIIFLSLPCKRWNGKDENHPDGSISSVRWKGKYRGKPGKSFQHAIILDVHISGKRISAKLSESTIQMTGAKSLQMATNVAKYIANHVNETLRFFISCSKEENLFSEAFKWLKNNSKGEPIETFKTTIINNMIELEEDVHDYVTVWPDSENIPEEYFYFVKTLIEKLDDVKYLSCMDGYHYIYSESVYTNVSESLSVEHVGCSMVNRNYKLGFPVDRLKLMRILRDYGISTSFQNTMHNFISVKMSSKIEDDDSVVRRSENLFSTQKFFIYCSGKIMHSGQGGPAMAECFYSLISVLANIKSEIKPDYHIDYSLKSENVKITEHGLVLKDIDSDEDENLASSSEIVSEEKIILPRKTINDKKYNLGKDTEEKKSALDFDSVCKLIDMISVR